MPTSSPSDSKPNPPSLPWPKHLTKEHYKDASNRFIGDDKTMLLKVLFSVRTLLGVGALAPLLLPARLHVLLVAALLLPQLIIALAKRLGWYQSHAEKVHPIVPGTHYGEIEGDFALFLIGARFNTVASSDVAGAGLAMQAMQRELESRAQELGYMSGESFVSTNPTTSTVLYVQYWRSMEQLNKYAKSAMNKHLRTMIQYGRSSRVESKHYSPAMG